MPTVVFNSALGGETIFWVPGNTAGHPDNQVVASPITSNPTVLNNPTVYFIFWGTSWTNANAQALANDAQTIIQSNFFSGLTDYGSDGLVTYGGYTIDNSAAPPADTGPATQEVQKILPTTAWATPQDTSPLDSPIYVVVTDTNGVTFGGWNGHPNYSASTVMNLIWIGDSGNSPDSFTYLLSHEVAERISDGTSTGIEMRAPVNAGTDGEWNPAQISDNEPDGGNYTYRLNGSLLVQAYWSLTYNAFVVPDGNTQTLYLNPNWNTIPSPPTFFHNFGLTIPFDGTVNLNENASGLSINLNGQNFHFGPGQITSITVNEGNGNDTVNVEGTVSGDPVTIWEGGGTDTVNVSPSAQFLDNIQGNITVNGGSGNDTLNVDDQNDPFNETWTMTSAASVTRTSAATIFYLDQDNVNITGGTGNNTYNLQGTEAFFTTNLDTGPGADTVNVQSTAPFSTLNINNLFSTSNHDTVNIGSTAPSLGGTLKFIAGPVNVANASGGGTALTIDDSGDTAGRTFTVTNSSVTGNWFAPINSTSGQVNSLTLLGGDGGNTFNVQSTASGTATSINVNDTSTSNNNNIVNVGSLAPSLGGTLANLAGPLSVSNSSGSLALVVDDSGDSRAALTTTITSSSVTGTWAAGAVNSLAGEVSALTFHSGTGGNTIDVLSTATTANLVGNTGGTTVNVGNAGSAQGIAGTLNIENPPSFDNINIDDSSDPGARTAILSLLGTNPADSEGNIDRWGQISSLAPGAINYEYGDVGTVTVNGAKGGTTFQVNDVPNVAMILNGTTGTNTLDGPNQANIWALDAALSGILDSNITFNCIENLVGGTGGDTFNLASPVPIASNIQLNSAGALNVAASAPAANILLNQGFDTVGPLGSPVTYVRPNGGVSAAADWYQFMGGPPNSTATTELLASTDPLPGGGGQMLHFSTNGGFYKASGNGVFENLSVLLPQGPVGMGAFDIYVPAGTAGEIGFGDYVTGAFDSGSAFFGSQYGQPIGVWYRVTFSEKLGRFGANELGFEIFSAGGGQIYVDNAFASTATSGAQFLTGTINNNGHLLTVTGAGKLHLEGAISGSGTLSMQGTGTLTLTASNSYSGNTTIASGTLVVTGVGTLGGAATSTTVDSGATLALYAINYSTPENLFLNGSGVGGAGALEDLWLAPTFAGSITLSSDSTIATTTGTTLTLTGTIANGGHLLTVAGPGKDNISGVISGTGGLKQTGGTLTLSANNTYAGGTTLSSGTLAISNANAVGTGTLTLKGGTLTASGGVVSLANAVTLAGNVTISGSHSLTFTGAVTLTGNRTLTVTSTGGMTISGAIGQSGGTWALTKAGAGTLILSGNNTYAGGTTISKGPLLIDGTQASSTVTVKSGATLGGTGTFGALSVLSGGIVLPGTSTSSTGILSSGNVTFASGSFLDVALNGTIPGSGYDQLNVTGTVSLGGSILNVSLGFTPTVGTAFTIIHNNTANAVVGTFNNLAEGATFVVNGMTFQITYKGGAGDDVVITRIA